jgi:essential nuclear protein 1
MPRVGKPQKPRHDPLHVELEQDNDLRRFGRVSKPGRKKRGQSDEAEAGEVSGFGYGAKMVVLRSLLGRW